MKNTHSPSPATVQSLITHYNSGRYKEVEVLAREVVDKFPGYIAGWKLLAQALKLNGKLHDSLPVLLQLSRLDSKQPTNFYNLGNTYKELGELPKAAKAFRKALTLKPDFSEAHNNLGTVLLESGMTAEAEAAFTKAVQINPKMSEAYNNLGTCFKDLGKLADAERAFKSAIKVEPRFAKAHYNLGNILRDLTRLNEAKSCYENAIRYEPDFSEAYSNLGSIHQQLGSLDSADKYYRKAIQLDPNSMSAKNNLASIAENQGNFLEAERLLREIIAQDPHHYEARLNLSIALLEQNKLDQAEEALQELVARKEKSLEAFCNLGVVRYLNGERKQALEALTTALEIDPQHKNSLLCKKVVESDLHIQHASTSKDTVSSRESALRSNPFVTSRTVEPELIETLRAMDARKFSDTKDARFGNGLCSPDFSLFWNQDETILKLVADLTEIMESSVKGSIFIYDSFFNILGAGGGTKPHSHITAFHDRSGLRLAENKYSLVYYLDIGDQTGSEPGILKLYDPPQEIFPEEGMIVIIPSARKHSAVYDGTTSRIMIGVNFYRV